MAKSLKIPKMIAGVKVPKRFRRSGKSLVHLLDSPIGRQAAAAALTAAAGVLAGTNRNLRHGVEQAGETVAHAATQSGDLVRSMAETAVGAVADTAREIDAPPPKPKKDVRQNAE